MSDIVRNRICEFDYDCGYEINPVDVAHRAAKTHCAHISMMANARVLAACEAPR
jgi:hypothetical protein